MAIRRLASDQSAQIGEGPLSAAISMKYCPEWMCGGEQGKGGKSYGDGEKSK